MILKNNFSIYFKNNLYIIFFYIILSLIPLLWFKTNIINGVDISWPYSVSDRFHIRIHGWLHYLGVGADRSYEITTLSFFFPYYLFDLLGFSIITSQKLTYCLWQSLVLLSAIYFANTFKPKIIKNYQLFIILFMFFYSTNYYMYFVWNRLQIGLSGIVLLPFITSFYYLYLTNKVDFKSFFFRAFIIYLICSSIGIQPPLFYVLFIFLFIFTILIYFINHKNQKSLEFFTFMKKYLLNIFLFILSNSFWFVGWFLFVIGSNYLSAEYASGHFAVNNLLNWVSKSTNLLNVMMNIADIGYFSGHEDTIYFPYPLNLFSKTYFFCFSIFLLICKFYAIKFSSIDKNILIFSIIFTLSIAFSSGFHFPFEWLYKFFLNIFPGFWILRAPWQKFGLILNLVNAYLLAIGLYLFLIKCTK